jgi:hypothetical protein
MVKGCAKRRSAPGIQGGISGNLELRISADAVLYVRELPFGARPRCIVRVPKASVTIPFCRARSRTSSGQHSPFLAVSLAE